MENVLTPRLKVFFGGYQVDTVSYVAELFDVLELNLKVTAKLAALKLTLRVTSNTRQTAGFRYRHQTVTSIILRLDIFFSLMSSCHV